MNSSMPGCSAGAASLSASPPLLSSVINNHGANAATDVRSGAKPETGLLAQRGAHCSKSAWQGTDKARAGESISHQRQLHQMRTGAGRQTQS